MNRAAKLISAAGLASVIVASGGAALASSKNLCSCPAQEKHGRRFILRNAAGVVVTPYTTGAVGSVVAAPNHIVKVDATVDADRTDNYTTGTYETHLAFATTSAADVCAQRFVNLTTTQSLYIQYTPFTYGTGPYKGVTVDLVTLCVAVETGGCTYTPDEVAEPHPH